MRCITITALWNLIAVCPRHHRLHHRDELGISGNADIADGVRFTNRHGLPMGPTEFDLSQAV